MSPIERREGLQVPEVCTVSPTSQPRVTMSVNETADLLGISRWLAYEQIQRGELPVIRMGRRLRVPVRPVLALVGMSWEDWLATQPRLRSA
jgi:excisionase family DNA binding protein